eukprot:5674417-Amphidinium_carterae.1
MKAKLVQVASELRAGFVEKKLEWPVPEQAASSTRAAPPTGRELNSPCQESPHASAFARMLASCLV